ncbi:MAG: tRNA (adenosine(37)-N6)-threonylcarbamoyltransferase complex transferase subunit TsaD [Patescibacteria group bacterium]|nr:tRNA (adenosine(37)-N6)-threonylcarbamoyltransferase complex transferase subunit TsaD [Patescibacteria group bacterium]
MNKKINKKEIIILAIDTSCDDTSVAVLKNRIVLSSVVSSQVELHQKWGGVVPDIARRAHQENIEKVYLEALKRAKIKEIDIDFFAVTYGPGLAIALEIGIDFAKNLATSNKKPLIPVNHMEGHLLSSLLLNKNGQGKIKINEEEKLFPALGLLISGNHSEIVYAKKIGDYKILGETLDDAAGEAFDKVARMLNLGYPGGPIVSSLADKAKKDWNNPQRAWEEKRNKRPVSEIAGSFGLPIPMMRSGDFNFSFSGLKTACLYKIKELREKHKKDTVWSYNFAREFINAISRSLSHKLIKVIAKHPEVKSVFVGGGVSNNKYIIREIGNIVRKLNKNYFIADKKFRSDNAAMIGIAAYYNISNKKNQLKADKILELDRKPMLRF